VLSLCVCTGQGKAVNGGTNYLRLFTARDSAIIHISTRNVSFSILIGQNSVAEWLSG